MLFELKLCQFSESAIIWFTTKFLDKYLLKIGVLLVSL